MSEVDFNKIDEFIEYHKTRKPKYVAVDDTDWENALLGYRECFSEAIDGDETTEQAWSLIYFSAIAFCRGMEYTEVKAGTRKESLYPRY